ncbi:mechanosensitive ion channel [Steroidobacter sp. S1-65]|uniref:Small-conductance mechanosensitive channel n=1 Tax=Steroidobacter gossypii TaxID=2805490 RepID=A0ABS1WZE0_9GAMM|nr:mechanosensitive ion channel family protein [Steroidobacter gossypii]MBM0106343.1 mechanosensitive ion channel [Steroidobacter gossypii]
METLSAIDQFKSTAVDLSVRFGPKLLAAMVIFAIGVTVSRWVGVMLMRGLERIELEPPVRSLLSRIARTIVLGLFMIMALQNLGVELLPLIAGLGVLGAGIALAMQGLLSDVAAGLSIIFSRPFRVGEYISVVDEEGTVEDISLFSTTLAHPDGSRVVIPNRKIVGEIYHNFGTTRELEISVGVAYDTDFDRAVAAIQEVLAANTRVLPEPAPLVQAVRLADSCVEMELKCCVGVDDYIPARGELTRAIVEICRERRIEIPFPRRDVHVIGDALLRDALDEHRAQQRSA